MKVGINARVLEKPDPAGVARYANDLLAALAELTADSETGASLEYVLFGVESVPEPLNEYAFVHGADAPAPTHSGFRAHLWEQLALPRAIDRHDVDVFHTPAGQPPVFATVPLVTTIHDISPVRHPRWFARRYAALYRATTPVAVRASDLIVTVSEFTRDEVVSVYPRAAGKTTAVHNGVAPPANRSESIGDLQPDEYLLFVGAANPRKNLRTLLEAYRWYRNRDADPVPLVVVGPERSVFADAASPTCDGVTPLGYVSDVELGWLYRNAVAFVFPSLYEGFGLPILEAMSVGTPVITGGRGAMAEVAGTAAHLANPESPTSLARGIDRVVNDEAYRTRLSKRGRERAEAFTWSRCAEQMIDVYRRANRA